jgi:hypothetical protein
MRVEANHRTHLWEQRSVVSPSNITRKRDCLSRRHFISPHTDDSADACISSSTEGINGCFLDIVSDVALL